MTKRISRKALALAAVGVLASPALAQVANAQIISKTIAVTLKAVGPLPTGVTGANVSVSCQNTTSNPGAIVSSFALTPGQTANLNNFNLTPVTNPGSPLGSSCSVTVTTTGTANRGVGAITISIGGATDKSGTNSTPGVGYSTGGSIIAAGLTNAGALTLTSNTVPVFDSTDVQITLTYPQITVKKVVVGDEATAGFAYPMSIACANPSDVRFISPANGLEGGNVTLSTSSATAATRAFRAAPNTRQLTMAFPSGSRVVTYTTDSATPLAYASITPVSDSVSGTVPAANGVGTSVGTAATASVNNADVLVSAGTGGGYVAGDLVIPGQYVLVQYFGQGNAANGNTPILLSAVQVFDGKNAGPYPAATAISLPAAGTAAAYSVTPTQVQGTNVNITGAPLAPPAGAIYVGPTTTVSSTVTFTSGAATALNAANQSNYVNALLINAPNLTAASSSTGSVIVYPFNYTGVVAAGGLIGNWANLGTGNPSLYTQVLNQILSEKIGGTVAPNTAGNPSFNGTFTLKAGDSRSFSFNEFPNLTPNSLCEVWETNGGGASVTAFSSTVPAINNVVQTPLGGLNNANGRFQSNLTKMNETITVTNSFLGDMIISKVVTGDPKTNVATYEISVACDKGGPKDTFLIKDRQSKVYSGIASGTNCLITETKSDGAVASYKDNSGDNTTDGRVTIKRRPIGGCGDVLGLTGAPTNATPGGPAPTTSFNECWASVIITNDYNPPATTEAPKAAAAAPATAAPATAAPSVAPAPATPVDATPTFAG
jgi:Domain of unknown function (DUF5979)